MINYRGERFSKYNSPKRTPGKSKKFAVLAKEGDKVRLVRFGDPNMRIRKSEPARRKSFRARHKCDEKKSKLTAGYWSCKKWWERRKLSPASMRRATTPNPPCVSVYLRRSSVGPRADGQVNGQLEKLKCLPRNTNPKAEGIATDGFKEVTEVPQAMDRTEVENRFRQEVFWDRRGLCTCQDN